MGHSVQDLDSAVYNTFTFAWTYQDTHLGRTIRTTYLVNYFWDPGSPNHLTGQESSR